MLNGSVLSKHFWTEAVRIACYTQNRSIIIKRHDKTPYEIFRERTLDINYFHVFRCPVFIHNYKDYLGKSNAKVDDGYFLGYSFVSTAFKVFNTRIQQVNETYHVTFNESMEAIRFTNTSADEIGIDYISRYPPDEFIHEDDPSRHSHPVPQDRWSKYQYIGLVNIIGGLGEGMLTRSMFAKLTTASTSECLFADFLSKIEPKKVSESLKHLGWVDTMQEELNQFYRNKVWTLAPLPYGKTAIGSKWVFRNKKDEHGIATKNKARLVAQDYSQEEGIDYNETFAPVARMEAIRLFIAFATYINFIVFQMDVKSAFLNGFDLKGYSNSDYDGCNMDRKSTSVEAEYVDVVGCCASILWMKSQLSDYDIYYKMVSIFCDNTKELIKKATEQAILLAITKRKVVKVVREEAKKIGIDLERITSTKEDVNIHPHTKHVVVTVYKSTNSRTFEVHNPFSVGAFGITKLDELGEIIPKNKNVAMKDLMTSLSRRYERIKKIPMELKIQSALPSHILKQASSKSSRRKRKHIELEPKIKVLELECDRSLLEGVPFVNNMVIEEPEYEIFFTDIFCGQAFQRWNHIHKVGVDSLVSYLVTASMIKTLENARFSLKLKKLVAEHPGQEKL
uniref:Retrovirus-related Pol polyprotein from transposon TNT 1-94 n=1 Tax=Tanacetum cinerariifolium TaxID=118510 RepID=A0A6L2JX65_TANCI|nr:retrovirus-related Pol polyprotein from transposon TNT 1-94 [Tanacetum cinerariifolium]